MILIMIMIVMYRKYVFITQKNFNLLLTHASCLFVTMIFISIFLIAKSSLLKSVNYFQNLAGNNPMLI